MGLDVAQAIVFGAFVACVAGMISIPGSTDDKLRSSMPRHPIAAKPRCATSCGKKLLAGSLPDAPYWN
jgi:hypothetical protein